MNRALNDPIVLKKHCAHVWDFWERSPDVANPRESLATQEKLYSADFAKDESLNALSSIALRFHIRLNSLDSSLRMEFAINLKFLCTESTQRPGRDNSSIRPRVSSTGRQEMRS